MTVEGDTLPSALMSLALHCMRTQLLQLCCLKLELKQSWHGAAHAWCELGNMTQLTGLLLHCGNEQVSAGETRLWSFALQDQLTTALMT